MKICNKIFRLVSVASPARGYIPFWVIQRRGRISEENTLTRLRTEETRLSKRLYTLLCASEGGPSERRVDPDQGGKGAQDAPVVRLQMRDGRAKSRLRGTEGVRQNLRSLAQILRLCAEMTGRGSPARRRLRDTKGRTSDTASGCAPGWNERRSSSFPRMRGPIAP